MKLLDILDDVNLKPIVKNIINKQEIDISNICYNSRHCSENALFVAVSGAKVNGKHYISDAIKNGAKVIVCDSIDDMIVFLDIVYIVVYNTRLALAYLSHIYYDYPAKKLNVIAVTGTNGKTTVTYLLKSILETANKKVGIIGTIGVFYNDKQFETANTTPESLDIARYLSEMLQEGVEYVAIEVSSHALVQHRVSGINFKIAAFTNLSHEHLDYHKSIMDYANAKKILFDSLEPGSVAVVNSDDKYAQYIISNCISNCETVALSTFSCTDISNADISKKPSYTISEVDIRQQSSSFSITNKSKKYDIKTQLTAFFNVQNAALSFAICKELHIEVVDILRGLESAKGAKGRLELITVCTGASAYVDYAHTPDALEKVLVQLREIIGLGKLICVFGCGGDRDKTKRSVMGQIANKYSDIVFVTDDNPRTESSDLIIKDILQDISVYDKIKIIPNRRQAIRHSVEISNRHDVILVAGKGHEDYQIIGHEKAYFSDIEELKSVFMS